MLIRFPPRRVRAAALIAAGLVAAVPASNAQAATDYCKYANTPVARLSSARASLALHCAINRARRENGVAPLKIYTALRGRPAGPTALGRAARAHARESVRLKWWDPNNGLASHVHPDSGAPPTPEGATQQIAARISAERYCPNGTQQVNENTFGWSGRPDSATGAAATPQGAVNWWLSDPPHRVTLLNPLYTEHGLGVVAGYAFPGPEYYPSATFVQNLGTCS